MKIKIAIVIMGIIGVFIITGLTTGALLQISHTQIAQKFFKRSDIYTLYRSSAAISNARIHIATFDTNITGGTLHTIDSYNEDNCRITAALFMSQPRINLNYWCEEGILKK